MSKTKYVNDSNVIQMYRPGKVNIESDDEFNSIASECDQLTTIIREFDGFDAIEFLSITFDKGNDMKQVEVLLSKALNKLGNYHSGRLGSDHNGPNVQYSISEI